MASESSANAGSNALRGNGASASPALRAESRKDDRDEGRSGVVGRDVRERELERLPPDSWNSVDIVVVARSFGRGGAVVKGSWIGGSMCGVANNWS